MFCISRQIYLARLSELRKQYSSLLLSAPTKLIRMSANFITIGSKGVSIPTGLTELHPPLAIGTNHLRWAGRGKVSAASDAHAWVSKNNEPFEIYLLERAVE